MKNFLTFLLFWQKKLDCMLNAIRSNKIGKGIVSEDQYWVPMISDIVLYPKLTEFNGIVLVLYWP